MARISRSTPLLAFVAMGFGLGIALLCSGCGGDDSPDANGVDGPDAGIRRDANAPPAMLCGEAGVVVDGACTTGCEIDGVYFAQYAKNPANSCEYCDTATSRTAFTPVGDTFSCASGGVCTNDVCGPMHTTTHDCSPACGGGKYCRYPLGPGFCSDPAFEGGSCTPGCPGCSPLPPPSCVALPAACHGTPSCGCLVATCGQGCGSPGGYCSQDADGDWVVTCWSC